MSYWLHSAEHLSTENQISILYCTVRASSMDPSRSLSLLERKHLLLTNCSQDICNKVSSRFYTRTSRIPISFFFSKTYVKCEVCLNIIFFLIHVIHLHCNLSTKNFVKQYVDFIFFQFESVCNEPISIR